MHWEQWDLVDWLKALGYGASVGAFVLGAAGDRRNATTWRNAATILGLIGGGIDLLEPPKHCGQRASYDPQLQAFVCPQCGTQIPYQPGFGLS